MTNRDMKHNNVIFAFEIFVFISAEGRMFSTARTSNYIKQNIEPTSGE